MKTEIPESNFLTAILTGIAITIAAGAILFPIIYFAFSSLFKLYVFTEPPPNAWIKDALLIIIFCAWLFVAAAAGGWACAGASIHNEYNHALFLSVLWTVIASLLYLYFASEEPFTALLLVITLGIAGYFSGTALRMCRKRKSRQTVK
ncbi:MAG TPA: hypothetical protein VHN59_05810 [Chitinophagaceae bacterium]|nr:hypothetical protein [Chitinophagaceae bacterium]